MPRHHGITLWEALLALAVLGVAATWATPAFRNVLLDARLTADVNAFVLAVQLARSEALKRGRPAVLCKTVDQQTCGGDDIEFDAGWMVFVNDDDERPPGRSSREPLLYFHQPAIEGTITANRGLFEFRPFRRRSTNGTVTFCDARGAAAARAVVVSYTGRPRVDRVGPGNRPLICGHLP